MSTAIEMRYRLARARVLLATVHPKRVVRRNVGPVQHVFVWTGGKAKPPRVRGLDKP